MHSINDLTLICNKLLHEWGKFQHFTVPLPTLQCAQQPAYTNNATHWYFHIIWWYIILGSSIKNEKFICYMNKWIPTWGPHGPPVGPMNLAIRATLWGSLYMLHNWDPTLQSAYYNHPPSPTTPPHTHTHTHIPHPNPHTPQPPPTYIWEQMGKCNLAKCILSTHEPPFLDSQTTQIYVYGFLIALTFGTRIGNCQSTRHIMKQYVHVNIKSPGLFDIQRDLTMRHLIWEFMIWHILMPHNMMICYLLFTLFSCLK